MTEPFWLAKFHVEIIHDDQLAQHGGLAGYLDAEALDSSLTRPKNAYLYQKCDLADLAATYAHGIIKTHPFHDGNKRTGFAVAAVFLDVNGIELTLTEPDATLAVLGLADGSVSQQKFAALLRKFSKKRKQRKKQ